MILHCLFPPFLTAVLLSTQTRHCPPPPTSHRLKTYVRFPAEEAASSYLDYALRIAVPRAPSSRVLPFTYTVPHNPSSTSLISSRHLHRKLKSFRYAGAQTRPLWERIINPTADMVPTNIILSAFMGGFHGWCWVGCFAGSINPGLPPPFDYREGRWLCWRSDTLADGVATCLQTRLAATSVL